MEKEILEILKAMQQDIKGLKESQERLEAKVDGIEKKLDGVVEQTADLLEFRTSVEEKLNELKQVEKVTKANCYDIAKLKLKAVKQNDKKEKFRVGVHEISFFYF